MKKKILILGANGYIGRFVYQHIKKNYLDTKNIVYYADLSINRNIKKNFFQIDVLKKSAIYNFLKKHKPDYILDLIGINWAVDVCTYYNINTYTKINLYEAIIKIKQYNPRILTIGSAAEYGEIKKQNLPVREDCKCNPVNHYGISKVTGTYIGLTYCKNYNLNITIARPFNILGPGLSENFSIGWFLKQIKLISKSRKKNNVLTTGNINTKRDFLDINDLIRALFIILEKGKSGKIYNICSGRSVRIKKILKILINNFNIKVKIVIDKQRIKKGDVKDIYGDNSELKKLGWKLKNNLNDSLIKI